LKADNIFITSDNELKIGDFGVSKVMSETLDMGKTKIGTPNIMAPEIISNQKYNQKSDIWSLGCVIYKMMTFKYPYEA
jgi:NIMA (never in mitosis gene a)-related kinase